jgi:hypothetical protein
MVPDTESDGAPPESCVSNCMVRCIGVFGTRLVERPMLTPSRKNSQRTPGTHSMT